MHNTIGRHFLIAAVALSAPAFSQTSGPANANPNPAVPREPNLRAIPVSNPAAWVQYYDYPPKAVELELQGKTRVSLIISDSGRITDCQMLRSSGAQSLDEAACIALKRRARYYPATDRNGQSTTGTLETVVIWRMPEQVDPFPDAPTPAANPALWVTTNPYDKEPVFPKGKPKNVYVRSLDRYYQLSISASGMVAACAPAVGQQWPGAYQKIELANDKQVCDQYKQFGRFDEAFDTGATPSPRTYYAKIRAKSLYKSD